MARFRKTKFYGVDLDRRLIREVPYSSEAASTQDGNRLTLRGAHLDRSPLYSTFAVADEQTWAGHGKRHYATKKSPAELQRDIDEVLSGTSDAFGKAKAESAEIEREVAAAGEALRGFPRSPLGGVSDAVRMTPEYRAAKARFDRAFARQRAFNTIYTKKFANELRAERNKRYGYR